MSRSTCSCSAEGAHGSAPNRRSIRSPVGQIAARRCPDDERVAEHAGIIGGCDQVVIARRRRSTRLDVEASFSSAISMHDSCTREASRGAYRRVGSRWGWRRFGPPAHFSPRWPPTLPPSGCTRSRPPTHGRGQRARPDVVDVEDLELRAGAQHEGLTEVVRHEDLAVDGTGEAEMPLPHGASQALLPHHLAVAATKQVMMLDMSLIV